MVHKDLTPAERFKPLNRHITIQFDNQKAAEHFLLWLSGEGEQLYWYWMEEQEKKEPKGDITAIAFDYQNPGQGVVTAECGRMDKE